MSNMHELQTKGSQIVLAVEHTLVIKLKINIRYVMQNTFQHWGCPSDHQVVSRWTLLQNKFIKYAFWTSEKVI